MQEIKHYINGQFISSESGRTVDDINLANGDDLAKVQESCRKEID